MHGTLSLPMRHHNAPSPSRFTLSRRADGLCIGCAAAALAAAGFALSLSLSVCKQPAGGADRSTLAPILRGSADPGPRGARCVVPSPAAAPAAGARPTRAGKRRAIIV
ncbi:hypothetical protein NU688_20395 [Variovorax sp. ZS18.2.2]|uniref:hypothetical protein n=1 Tax=Variovorax sp. ZS18.2.2 TaxID=2971255 RepID=UPI002151EDDE|nr:hypothetical protein [Variovorax sp. ZS18.2.2]MCR6478528.1 hypothetical protein [Variovorax sp. ZS18.2.2]